MKREGWAAAVGSRYKTKNGTTVLIGRYTAGLKAELIEGREADEPKEKAQARDDGDLPEFPFHWNEDGKCLSHGTFSSDFDLTEAVRGGAHK
jgi:hypothetical protein